MSFIDVLNIKKYLKRDSDQILARVGHVNAVADIAVSNEAAITGAGLPSKVYKASLTQTGTAAPVATIFANTFGAPLVITRASAGVYNITLTGAFLSANTEVVFSPGATVTGDTNYVGAVRISNNVIQVVSTTLPATPADDILVQFNITISVY
jgi:hypothetical protein